MAGFLNTNLVFDLMAVAWDGVGSGNTLLGLLLLRLKTGLAGAHCSGDGSN